MAALGVRWLSRGAACVVVAALVWFALRSTSLTFAPAASMSTAQAFAEIEIPAPRPAPRTTRRPPPTVAAVEEAVEPAHEPSLPRVEIADPQWLQRPRHPERRYPGEALAAGIEGAVELDCEVSREGRLACFIASETPPGWGFGEAALALADEHVMAPVTHEGAPALGHLRMRVPFTQTRSE